MPDFTADFSSSTAVFRLIQCRGFRLEFLNEKDSVDLLCHPTPDFPEVIPREVAMAAYRQCGGQPYLLQLIGYELVRRLNRQIEDSGSQSSPQEGFRGDLPRATLSMLEEVCTDVVEQASSGYFAALWRHNFSEPLHWFLYRLAHGERQPLTPPLRIELKRHGLLKDTHSNSDPLTTQAAAEPGEMPAYPMLLAWVRIYVLEEAGADGKPARLVAV